MLVHEVLHLRIILFCSRYSIWANVTSLCVYRHLALTTGLNLALSLNTSTKSTNPFYLSWDSSCESVAAFLTSECVGGSRTLYQGVSLRGKLNEIFCFIIHPLLSNKKLFSWLLCFHMRNFFNNISKHSK